MSAHPSPQRLERFMTGVLPREEAPKVLKHLVKGCQDCSATTSRLWEVLVTGRQAPDTKPEDYERAFDRAWLRANQVYEELTRERESAGELSREFLALPPQQQQLRLRNDRRYQTLPLAKNLIDASQSAIFDDAGKAAHLATLAREIVCGLEKDRYGAAILADAQAEAWAAYANAVREGSDHDAAERALETARSFLEDGTGDPLTKAQYLSSLANLLINGRRLDESLQAIRELEAIYSKLGDRHMVGRVYLKKAFALSKQGDLDGAIQDLRRALELLDPGRDPKRRVAALHNLVNALLDTNRLEEAEQHLERLRQLHTEQGDRLNLLRFRWLEAQLAYAKRDFETATMLFSEVRDRFIELEIGIDAALVSIELAEVLFQQGRLDKTQRRLGEAIPILKALGLHPEALAAMAFLEHSVRVQSATRGLIRQTGAFIRRVRSDPTTRFRPSELNPL